MPAELRHGLIACCGTWKCSCQACPACAALAAPPSALLPDALL
jgi:hypothetical protein